MKVNNFKDFEINESYSEDSEEDNSKEAVSKHLKRKYEDIPSDAPKSKKKNKNDLYKQPTVEELNNLRETENLFNNNLFRLQIDEVLSEIKIKTKRENKLNKWLQEFKSCLKDLPENEILLSTLFNPKKKKGKLLSKITTYKLFKADQDVTIKFLKPEEIECFGLYENKCLPGPNLTLNISLSIPKECFLIKDYLNNRYIVKKYYYLLYLIEYIKNLKIATDIKLSFYENNDLLPVIELLPKDTDKTVVFIFVVPAENTFKPSRFLPPQNNCKLDLFDEGIDNEVLKNTPTLYYNSLLAHDVTLETNIEFLKSVYKDQTNIQNGVKLLIVWLRQRDLQTGLGAFTETMVLYLVAYLFDKKKINKFMSSYQIIRNFWNFITATDLLTEPISIGNTTQEVLNNFKKHYSIVFLDSTCCYNIMSFLNIEVYKKVKVESQAALKNLDNNKYTSFNELFLTKYPFHLQYDLIVDIPQDTSMKNLFNISKEEQSTFLGYNSYLNVNHIIKILQKGFSKRVLNIVPKWDVKNNQLLFGINLNSDEAFNFLEKGPALNDFQNAADFREFWKPLATDRRFKDGSTNVAVHFKTNTIKSKRNIIKKILDFLLGEKLKLNYKVFYNEFEDLLVFKKIVPCYPSGTNEETSLKIILSANELNKKLRELNLSLKISGVQGISEVFAYSEVFPPIPSNFKVLPDVTIVQEDNLIFDCNSKSSFVPRFVQPIESVLQLEHSSKWPNDLTALRHIKTSFYIEIGKMLKSNHKLLTHASKEFLDIFYEGIVFRYKLFVPKEIGLVKKIETEDGLTTFKESEESFDLEMKLNILPKIMGALKGLQSQYPSFGPGACLIKRWLRAHLIDEYHISDTVIDLLNASLYLNSSYVSNTPQISFLRFLKFVSELDWDLQLILVNFNNDLSNDVISNIESEVQSNRKSYPNLFILTPFDQNSSLFTKNSPSKEILFRIKQLALESLKFMEKIILGQDNIGIKDLFVPNFDGYNVLIHMRHSLNSKRHEQITFNNVEGRIVIDKYEWSDEDKIPIINFNPVTEYLLLLRRNYGKYAIFFHDSYGGNVIGVLWHPRIFETSDFKIAKVNGGKIDNGKIVFNMDAVIEDFYILGKDIVKNIEKR